MKSMTGFGRGSVCEKGITAVVEISAVNSHKALDMRCNIPRELGLMEAEFRTRIQKRLSRGTLAVSVSYQRESAATELAESPVNFALAEMSLKELRKFAQEHGLALPTLHDVLLVPGVLQEAKSSVENVKVLVLEALEKALDALEGMRVAEGANLRMELALRGENMQALLDKIIAREPETPLLLRDRICQRIAELGVELPVDDERLSREVAFYVDKADITEEMVRLKSHLQRYRILLDTEADAGKNFDFLVQELSREINTLSAKTADTAISEDALAFKIELSKVKEQIANVE